jgi:hypothetical protein
MAKVIAEGDSTVITEYQKPPKAEPKPKPADAELKERAEQVAKAGDIVAESLFDKRPEKKKEPEVKAEPKDDKKPEVKVEDKPKPTAKKKAEPTPKPAPSADEVADKAADRAARRVLEDLAPKGDEKPDEASGLTPEDRRHYEIFKVMAEDKKYAKLPEEFLAFAKQRYEYEQKWLKDNPGKEFDPAAEEHETFFKKQPAFNDDDYDDARIEIRVRRTVEGEVKKRLTPLEQEREAERIRRDIEPKLTQAVWRDAHEFVKEVAPEIASLLTGDKGAPDWSKENLAKAEAEHPIVADVISSAIQELYLPLIDTAHRMFTQGMIGTVNPELPATRKIWEEIDNFEKVISNPETPAEIKTRDGKQFTTIKNWHTMVQQVLDNKATSQETKQAKLKELDGKYWTIDLDDVKRVISKEIAGKVKSSIEKRKQVSSREHQKTASAPKTPVLESDKGGDVSQPKNVQVAASQDGGQKKPSEIITASLFPR